MGFLYCTRILQCFAGEWARGEKLDYRPKARHKRTLIPPIKQFSQTRRNPTGIPWIDRNLSIHFAKKYGERNTSIKRRLPNKKRSLASIYEHCSVVAEKKFSKVEYSSPGSMHLAHCGVTTQGIYQALSKLTPPEIPPGQMSFKGKCFLEYELAKHIMGRFPRLRSVHLQELMSLFCNLQPIATLASTVSLIKEFDLTIDVDLWRELNILHIQKHHYSKQIREETDRIAMGNISESIAQNKKLLRFIQSQIHRRLPATKEELMPVMEWLRCHFYAWLAYFYRTRGEISAKRLLGDMIFPRFCVSESSLGPLERNKFVVNDVLSSSGGWRSAVQPVDQVFERRKAQLPCVPEVILRCLNPSNALKEAQIILRHSPDVPGSLRSGKLCFREKLASHHKARNTEEFGEGSLNKGETLTSIDFYCGSKLLGRGDGCNIQQGMQEACTNMVSNFYSRSAL